MLSLREPVRIFVGRRICSWPWKRARLGYIRKREEAESMLGAMRRTEEKTLMSLRGGRVNFTGAKPSGCWGL